MKKNRSVLTCMFVLIIFFAGCKNEPDHAGFDSLYFGLEPPGMAPEIFAPGVVNTDAQNHSCVTISPDGKEIYWSQFSSIAGVRQERIWFSEYKQGKWSQPQVTPFSGTYREGGPHFSLGGKRLYFSSLRPVDQNDVSVDANIWYVEKTDLGWADPVCLDQPVNSEFEEWFPTLAKNGNIYFMFRNKDSSVLWDIYCSEFKGNKYMNPQKLGDAINSQYVEGFSFVDPDERFFIFYSERPGGLCEGGELYISFCNLDGTWADAVNMGEKINRVPSRFPGLSPDGNYFFFSNYENNKESIYWIDARIIDSLNPKVD